MKTHIYRAGDQVEVLAPLWVKRVGYPLHWEDFVADVEASPATTEALRVLGWTRARMPYYFMQAVAKMRVEKANFGGNGRVIVYHKLDEPNHSDAATFDQMLSFNYPHHGYVGRVVEVHGKRTAYTGTRYPAGGSGEDWEPGGLADRQAHVILRTTFGEIEACNVRLVKASKK